MNQPPSSRIAPGMGVNSASMRIPVTQTRSDDVGRGSSAPLGATLVHGGANFSVFSRRSRRLELCFFDSVDSPTPSRIIELDPRWNRTFPYWHVFVPGVIAGQLYGFRSFGPSHSAFGDHFDAEKLLLDPYGRLVAVPQCYDRDAARRPGGNCREAMKSVVVDVRAYDWEGDEPLGHAWGRTIIYELHVGGFTKHPNSGVTPNLRGTYAGLIEKIPYLKQLGITAVELLPIFQYDEQDAPVGIRNYWGYAPISFFAPHAAYSSGASATAPLDELRDMIKALHRADIEVILDVVYNHTAEGDSRGPTSCFKGFDNPTYYILHDDQYANYSGTGNTLNANNPVVRRLIQDSLRYWVQYFHIDGFRFDLASILARGAKGQILTNPHTLWSIETDPALAGTKLIAEPWDAGGLYQVGSFVGDRWAEWNGRFRDDVRAFVKGDRASVPKVANRLLASPDIYEHEGREPEQSINFVSCHDGFTLNDVVSYNEKHNAANGEGNRDGHNYNLSWNCGVEGPTNSPAIEALRSRQVKNLLTITLLSMGVPMLLMGDEVRRTQYGNNNAYCQDNELGWFDWRLLETYADVRRFVELLIRFRQATAPLHDGIQSLTERLEQVRIEWHGIKRYQPDWGDDSRTLALTLRSPERTLHLMLNSLWEPLDFELPQVEGGWRRLVDTYQSSPNDIVLAEDAPLLGGETYMVQARTTVLLVAPGSDAGPLAGHQTGQEDATV